MASEIAEIKNNPNTSNEMTESFAHLEPSIEHISDPEQTIIIHRLLGINGGLIMIIVVLSVALIYLLTQKPRTLVVDRTHGEDRVVMMDDKAYGLSDTIQFKPDSLTNEGKIYLVRNFLEFFYGNNPDYRAKQLETVISLLDEQNGNRLYQYLKDSHKLEQEARESWQATWTTQSIEVDRENPFLVRAIGTQKLKRKANGTTREEVNQLSVTIPIYKDPLGRTAQNLQTGYRIDKFDWKTLKSTGAESEEATAQNIKTN